MAGSHCISNTADLDESTFAYTRTLEFMGMKVEAESGQVFRGKKPKGWLDVNIRKTKKVKKQIYRWNKE